MEGLLFAMFFLILMDLGLNIYSLVLIASDYRKDGE
jgi:hypothetical protein|nr:MAG TPA: hypothetical protein [Microviridae sp.]DAM43839.1 MAG TPA: hypothetical protein [Microviridae sp.]